MSSLRIPSLLLALALAACHSQSTSPVARHSSSIAVSPDGSHVYVVNADVDSVSVINTGTRQLEREILLASAAPAVDADGKFTPAVSPRALAVSPHANRLFVSGERSGQLYTLDLTTNTVLRQTDVGSEPFGVLVSPDESSIYVACSNDDKVVRVDASTGKVVASVQTQRKPWALAWSNEADALYVTHLLGPGVSVLKPDNLAVQTTWTVPDLAPRDDARLANGQVRGLYDVVVQPATDALWTPHLLLATHTPQPALNFETTVFPTLSILKRDGTLDARLSTDAQDVPGIDGAFGDIVSGPQALEFTRDGKYALMLDTASEDILAVDVANRVEATLLRPLPGHMPQGLVVSPDGAHAYVDERNSGDVAVIKLDTSGATIALSVDGDAIPRLTKDPMPAQMRLGQHLFFSANSDEYPVTRNHWVACSSCHIEGRSDGVTWRFIPGPRDTPTNAGGVADTGFLLHTADRRTVQDYWHTINAEQGGNYTPNDATQAAQLDALEVFINRAMPTPIPPHTNPDLVARGKAIFERADVGCAQCHYGSALTDSGANNPTLDLNGTVLLHDVGTCAQGTDYLDVPHPDDADHMRDPCQFDTSALRGLVDSAPYFHDGSAATLRDALEKTRGKMGNINVLSPDELDALIEYLRSL